MEEVRGVREAKKKGMTVEAAGIQDEGRGDDGWRDELLLTTPAEASSGSSSFGLMKL